MTTAAAGTAPRLPLELVVPVRWDRPVPGEVEEDFTAWLRTMAATCDVTVVDGSTRAESGARRDRWAEHVRVLRPSSAWAGPNGKVTGAMTGIAAARHDRVVLADDDVRHDRRTLHALDAALDDADLVLPQNHPSHWPWWAWWDGGRVLLNRAVAVDWPGTVAVRRDVIVRAGGWSPEVLFENLEMVRTVRASGGRVVHRPEVLVPRRPPTRTHFLQQRVRQAYDDRAQPARLAVGAAVLPWLVANRARPLRLALTAVAAVALAEVGRRRQGGRVVFPWHVPLAAPVWLLERGVCTWLAMGAALRGGARYAGTRFPVAAHSTRRLRRCLHARAPAPPVGTATAPPPVG